MGHYSLQFNGFSDDEVATLEVARQFYAQMPGLVFANYTGGETGSVNLMPAPLDEEGNPIEQSHIMPAQVGEPTPDNAPDLDSPVPDPNAPEPNPAQESFPDPTDH